MSIPPVGGFGGARQCMNYPTVGTCNMAARMPLPNQFIPFVALRLS